MTHNELISSLKAQVWEEAKGKLRALVALDGSKSSGIKDEDGEFPFKAVEKAVEAFIEEFSGNGHHE